MVGGAGGAPVALVQRWARETTVVLYDARGFGLSAAASMDLSLEARLRDLDAVVAAVGEPPVTLRGMGDAAGVAVAFAATRPEKVRSLVLFAPYASGTALLSLRPGMQEALFALINADRSVGIKALTTVLFGEATANLASAVDISSEALAVLGRAMAELEVSHLLGKVTAPTLIIHGREDALVPVQLGRAVAAAIRGARLYEYEGAHLPPNAQIVNDVTRVISEFLAVSVPDDSNARAAEASLRIVLFTDLVGHTEMMRRLGDERGREVLRQHERITRDLRSRCNARSPRTRASRCRCALD
jgi:pimeloyl-ACP methyl ester carboxylesterase